MITIGMNYHVIRGKEEIFENAFNGVANALLNANGHEFSRLYQDCKETNKYLIISKWKDHENFQSFVTSDAFRNVTNWGALNILAERPSHQIF